MGVETAYILVENGHCKIMKERKLTCDYGRNSRTGVRRGEGIRSRRYGSKSNIWAEGRKNIELGIWVTG